MTEESVPVYPLPAGKRLSKFDWFPMYVNRLNSSRFVACHDYDVIGVALILWAQAMQQDPIGTLPDSDMALAHMVGLRNDIEAWRALRVRGALYGFSPCLVKGSQEVRLAHPVVTEVAIDMVTRDDAFQSKISRSRIKSKVFYMRGQLKKAGLHKSFYGDESRVLRVIDVIGQDLKTVENVRQAAILVGEQEALDSGKITNLDDHRQ